jgi:hypothetical protein
MYGTMTLATITFPLTGGLQYNMNIEAHMVLGDTMNAQGLLRAEFTNPAKTVAIFSETINAPLVSSGAFDLQIRTSATSSAFQPLFNTIHVY